MLCTKCENGENVTDARVVVGRCELATTNRKPAANSYTI